MIRSFFLVMVILLAAGCNSSDPPTAVSNDLTPSDLMTFRRMDTEDGPMVQVETSVRSFRAERLSFVQDDKSSEIVASEGGLTMRFDDGVITAERIELRKDSLAVGNVGSFKSTAQP